MYTVEITKSLKVRIEKQAKNYYLLVWLEKGKNAYKEIGREFLTNDQLFEEYGIEL